MSKSKKVEYLLNFNPKLSSFVRVDLTNQSGDTKQYIMDDMTMLDYSGKANIKNVRVRERFECGDTKAYNDFKKESLLD